MEAIQLEEPPASGSEIAGNGQFAQFPPSAPPTQTGVFVGVGQEDIPPTDGTIPPPPPQPQSGNSFRKIRYPGYPDLNLHMKRGDVSIPFGVPIDNTTFQNGDEFEAFLGQHVYIYYSFAVNARPIWEANRLNMEQNNQFRRLLDLSEEILLFSRALYVNSEHQIQNLERLKNVYIDLLYMFNHSGNPQHVYATTIDIPVTRAPTTLQHRSIRDCPIDPNRIIHPFSTDRGDNLVTKSWESPEGLYPRSNLTFRLTLLNLPPAPLGVIDITNYPRIPDAPSTTNNPQNHPAPPPQTQAQQPAGVNPQQNIRQDTNVDPTLIGRINREPGGYLGLYDPRAGEIVFQTPPIMPIQPARFTNIVTYPPQDLAQLKDQTRLIQGIYNNAREGQLAHPNRCILTHSDVKDVTPQRSTYNAQNLSRTMPGICDQCAMLIFGFQNDTCEVPATVVNFIEGAARENSDESINYPCNSTQNSRNLEYPCTRYYFPYKNNPRGDQYPIIDKGTILIPRLADIDKIINRLKTMLSPEVANHVDIWTLWETIKQISVGNGRHINPVFVIYIWKLLRQMLEDGIPITLGGLVTAQEIERRAQLMPRECGSNAIINYLEIIAYLTILEYVPRTTTEGRLLTLPPNARLALDNQFNTTSGVINIGPNLQISINNATREHLNTLGLFLTKILADYTNPNDVQTEESNQLHPKRRLHASLVPFFRSGTNIPQTGVWEFFINGLAPGALALPSSFQNPNDPTVQWRQIPLTYINVTPTTTDDNSIVSTKSICNHDILCANYIRELSIETTYQLKIFSRNTSQQLKAFVPSGRTPPPKMTYQSAQTRRAERFLVTDQCRYN